MKFSLKDHRQSALFEVEIRFRGDAIKGLLFDRDGGIMPALWNWFILLSLLYFSVTFQSVLPRYFPELWFNFSAAGIAYIACRRSILTAMLSAVCCGWLLDTCSGLMPGPNLLMLTLGTSLLFAIPFFTWQGLPQLRTIVAAGMINLVHTAGMLCCFGGGMPWSQRGILLLEASLFGSLLTALAWTPMVYALMELVIFRKPENATK